MRWIVIWVGLAVAGLAAAEPPVEAPSAADRQLAAEVFEARYAPLGLRPEQRRPILRALAIEQAALRRAAEARRAASEAKLARAAKAAPEPDSLAYLQRANQALERWGDGYARRLRGRWLNDAQELRQLGLGSERLEGLELTPAQREVAAAAGAQAIERVEAAHAGQRARGALWDVAGWRAFSQRVRAGYRAKLNAALDEEQRERFAQLNADWDAQALERYRRWLHSRGETLASGKQASPAEVGAARAEVLGPQLAGMLGLSEAGKAALIKLIAHQVATRHEDDARRQRLPAALDAADGAGSALAGYRAWRDEARRREDALAARLRGATTAAQQAKLLAMGRLR